MTKIALTALAETLPSTVPFVGPETCLLYTSDAADE